ncbi:MAG: hypothetical protein QXM76_03540, partial [Zestosphaera sp.]
MGLSNPYAYLRRSITTTVGNVLKDRCISAELNAVLEDLVEEPPRREFGDLSIHVTRISRMCDIPLEELLSSLTESLRGLELVSRVDVVGNYVNVFIDYSKFGALVLNSIIELGARFGIPGDHVKERVIVEYISANPVHPLHVGS